MTEHNEATRDESWRGQIGPLERKELDAFLAAGRICRLACLRDDGWPYIVPCWYEWDGADFSIIPRKRSAWARYIQRDSRVCLSIDEETPPLRKVQVLGHGRIVEEPNVGGTWVQIAERMAIRYLGEHGPDYLVPTLDQPRWLIRVEPLEITTWQGVAWHPRYMEPGTSPTPTARRCQ
jgi:nitroimidazol reductase NimA-like FMN-containing flavoprotein (pyridoxamine 5'-phosphate oxidase superfamily)